MNKNFKIKLISISTLIILCIIVMFTYLQYDSYKTNQLIYSNIKKNMKKELNIYIRDILIENKKKAELITKTHGSNIQNKLLIEYDDQPHILENDISNPNPNSKLSNILDNTLDKVYINSDNSSNKPFVISMDKFIWNRYMKINNNDNLIINNFIKNQYNNDLCKKSIDIIRNMNSYKYDFIFWELASGDKKHKKISMNINKLLELYHEEGLNSLKSYDLLIPVYITNKGDIFGTRDLDSVGKQNKNYKIIIIQKVNIFDALINYNHDILYFENQIIDIQDKIYNSKKKMARSVEESLIFIIFVLCISGNLQKHMK